jgi:DNA polymerase elongation subunit (family B)
MILWGKDVEVAQAAAWGEQAAEAITRHLRAGAFAEIGGAGALVAAASAVLNSGGDSTRSPPRDLGRACSAVALAYEKTYRPYLLLKKKNYVGLKYTGDGKGGFKTEMDMKGIDAVRRDRPKLLRETCVDVLHALMHERSVPHALTLLRARLASIASGSTPLEDFVLSKSLKGSYASANLPHLAAWKRMSARGDEDIPPVGSRMPYVVVLDKSGRGGRKAPSKLYERTEHPAHVRAAALSVDFQYYVETLENPIVKLLRFVAPEDDLKRTFSEAAERAQLKASNTGSLRGLIRGGYDDFGGGVAARRGPAAKKLPAKRARGVEETPTRGLRAFLGLESTVI